jgi:PAS domain S-box-containing protein
VDGTSPLPLGEHFAEIVLELAPDGIAVTDESGRILHANGRFEDLFGYTREQLVGHAVEMLLPQRVRAVHRDHRAQYEQHPATRPMGSGLELWARHADGSELRVEVALSPVSTETGVRTIMAVREARHPRPHEVGRSALPEHVEGDRPDDVLLALGDRVVQPLFGVGLQLHLLLDALPSAEADRLDHVITELDEAIHALQALAFQWDVHLDRATGPGHDDIDLTGHDASTAVEYCIDADDRLVAVNHAWDAFARENGAPQLVAPLPGRPIWQSFASGEVRELWRLLIERVRHDRVEARVPFRCDAPGMRRWFEMTITPGRHARVSFRSALVFEEPRPTVSLIDLRAERDSAGPAVEVCSLCSRGRDGARWSDLEDLMRRRRLLEAPQVPPVAYGVCPPCEALLGAGAPTRGAAPPPSG